MLSKTLTLFKTIEQQAWWVGYASSAFSYLLWFIIPIKHFIILTIFLIISNFILDLLNSINTKELERSGAKLIIIFLAYFIGMLTSEGMRIVFSEAIPFTYLMSGAICYYEFKLIIDNVEKITGVKIWANINNSKINIKKYAVRKNPLQELQDGENPKTTDLSSSYDIESKTKR